MPVLYQVAREALSELEVPHLYRAVARGSPKRQLLFEARGRFQVPYLEVSAGSDTKAGPEAVLSSCKSLNSVIYM